MDDPDGREQGAIAHPTGGSQAVCARGNSPPPTRPGRGTSAGWDSDGRAPDRAVFHGDSLAKNAAARVKQSRSWVTRANSRFRRVNSSASVRCGARVVPWAAACRSCERQRYNTLSGIPTSRATWAKGVRTPALTALPPA
jgi:ribosomal protein L40E